MDDQSHAVDTPPGWAEALDESLAELAAGMIVSGETVMRELRQDVVEAQQAPQPHQGTIPRR